DRLRRGGLLRRLLLGTPAAASARGEHERQRGGHCEQLNDERGTSAHYISFRIRIRSSSGGWVSNARFSHDPFFEPSPLVSPSSAPRSSGDSIHIWAVARVAWWTTALSFLSFSSPATSPGGSRARWTPLRSASLSPRRLT